MERKAFGIDLGTTNSAIAVFENDEASIIKNAEGFDITPSVVFFTGVDSQGNDESLIGTEAKNSAATSPENVVQFIKRFMGYHGSQYNHIAPSGKEYTPEMISALILRKVCQGAEQTFGAENVKDVVITVPAYFDDARRTATKQAGELAGLNVLGVINEPTAAAISFGLDLTKNGKVLVYDLGGGTFDVTIMNVNGGNFDVIATDGDHELGGVNFDQKLMALLIRKLNEQGLEVDDENDALMAELREKAERTKIQLSNVETARPAFTIDNKTYRIEVTCEEFEKECDSLMQQTELLLESTLKAAGIGWDDIDHLLAVGGSTRMKMVKKLLERLSGKTVVYKVDPDTAVAQGAAVYASTLLSGEVENSDKSNVSQGTDIAKKITISDVTSQSLGVISLDNMDREQNTIIIPHNTKIPAKRSEKFETRCDNQQSVKVRVTEGNETEVEYVKVVGEKIIPIPAYPKGSPIEIIYAYDIDQTVYVEVIDKATDKSLGTFEIDRSSNLSEDEMKNATGIISATAVD